MPDSVNLFSGGFYAVPIATANQNTAYTDGRLISSIAVNRDVSTTITAITSINTTAAGVKFTNFYRHRVPYQVSLAPQIRARCRWVIAANSPAGATGRINIDVRRADTAGNIAVIPGVVKASGVPRALDPGPGTVYADSQITVDVPNQTFVPGESIVILVEFEVLATAAGSSLAVTLRTDPTTVGDELIIEIDVGQP
jgi:hypothetical protein